MVCAVGTHAQHFSSEEQLEEERSSVNHSVLYQRTTSIYYNLLLLGRISMLLCLFGATIYHSIPLILDHILYSENNDTMMIIILIIEIIIPFVSLLYFT